LNIFVLAKDVTFLTYVAKEICSRAEQACAYPLFSSSLKTEMLPAAKRTPNLFHKAGLTSVSMTPRSANTDTGVESNSINLLLS